MSEHVLQQGRALRVHKSDTPVVQAHYQLVQPKGLLGSNLLWSAMAQGWSHHFSTSQDESHMYSANGAPTAATVQLQQPSHPEEHFTEQATGVPKEASQGSR